MEIKGVKSAVFPILFGFFVMGFVDVVGIATNYVKMDFDLSDTLALCKDTRIRMLFLGIQLYVIKKEILEKYLPDIFFICIKFRVNIETAKYRERFQTYFGITTSELNMMTIPCSTLVYYQAKASISS